MPGKSRKIRFKPIYEMRREQKKTCNIIPAASFARIVYDIAHRQVPDIRFKKEAIQALQVDAESFLIDTLYKANTLAVECGRETLTVHDVRVLHRLNTAKIT